MSETYHAAYSIPRDPSAYRRTDHFTFRFNRRSNPEPTGRVVRECITEGDVYATHDPERRFFEATVPSTVDGQLRDVRWRVFVHLREAAFVLDSEKHVALTVYAPEYHAKDEDDWSV